MPLHPAVMKPLLLLPLVLAAAALEVGNSAAMPVRRCQTLLLADDFSQPRLNYDDSLAAGWRGAWTDSPSSGTASSDRVRQIDGALLLQAGDSAASQSAGASRHASPLAAHNQHNSAGGLTISRGIDLSTARTAQLRLGYRTHGEAGLASRAAK